MPPDVGVLGPVWPEPLPGGVDVALIACLTSSREQGLLGPMPVHEQVRHALGMANVLAAPPPTVVDLGAGGGVPGLALARLVWPDARWWLIEANARRAAFLREAVQTLGLGGRVEVVVERAEAVARDGALRHQIDAVLARSFGPPAVTAECAAPLLTKGGRVVVSEPPKGGSEARWPADGLELLGLVIDHIQTSPVHVVTLRSATPCSERYPRRVGIPSKRPLF